MLFKQRLREYTLLNLWGKKYYRRRKFKLAKEAFLKLLNENLDKYSTDNIYRLQKLIISRNLAFENRLRSFLKLNN